MVASRHMPEIHIPKLEKAHKAEATYYGDAVFMVVSRQVVEISRAFREFTTAWTLPPPWTERAPSTAAWKPPSGFHKRPHRSLRDRRQDLLRRWRQPGRGELLHRLDAEIATLRDRPLLVLFQ